MHAAEHAAQRLITKLILILMIEHGIVTHDDVVASFSEAKRQLAEARLEPRVRIVLIGALDSVLRALAPPRPASLH